jgi:hypothetical protein
MVTQAANADTGVKSIRQVTGATFVSIIMGLVLKNILDTVFKDVALQNGIWPIITEVINKGSFSLLVAAQIFIFLFTLVRFYLGSFRYHEEEPQVRGVALDLIVDIFGAVGVFVSFYATSLFIKTGNMFYVGFAAITLIDLVWFAATRGLGGLKLGMEIVAEWFVLFDIITLISLIGFFIIEEMWKPWPSFLPQWLALAVLFAIGCWDFRRLLPFYTGAPKWQENLKRRRSKRQNESDY